MSTEKQEVLRLNVTLNFYCVWREFKRKLPETGAASQVFRGQNFLLFCNFGKKTNTLKKISKAIRLKSCVCVMLRNSAV